MKKIGAQWKLVGCLAAILCALVLTARAVDATAQPAPSPAPPINDNYIDSLNLNNPGHPLNSVDTLKDVRDTTNATVQSNILSPPYNLPGPAEVTSCDGVSYGKTIWYDFYPNHNGLIRIRTSGFDNVISLWQFNTHTALPDDSTHKCVHESDFPSEELDASVSRGKAYTFQIGGVNDAGGMLEMLFDFFVTPPHRLSPSVTLKARALSDGIQLLSLVVDTARAANVSVSCDGHCQTERKFGKAVETFPGLANVTMPSGSNLVIRVTAKHSIGAFVEYHVLPGNFEKIIRCTEPGSRRPRTVCH